MHNNPQMENIATCPLLLPATSYISSLIKEIEICVAQLNVDEFVTRMGAVVSNTGSQSSDLGLDLEIAFRQTLAKMIESNEVNVRCDATV